MQLLKMPNKELLQQIQQVKRNYQKAKKDYDGDGKIESGSEEYLGAKDKAIKAAQAGKMANKAAKDVMRSFAHELVHHAQNEQGKFKKSMNKAVTELGYAQKNKDLRKLEMDAFRRGNIIFRDYTDKVKMGEPINESEDKNMNKKLLVERVMKRVVERLKKLAESPIKAKYLACSKLRALPVNNSASSSLPKLLS